MTPFERLILGFLRDHGASRANVIAIHLGKKEGTVNNCLIRMEGSVRPWCERVGDGRWKISDEGRSVLAAQERTAK